MTDLATIGFRAETSDLDKADRKLKKLADTGQKTEKKTDKSMGVLSGGFAKLAGAVGVAYAAISQLQQLTTISRQFDVLNAQLITATGSAESAGIAFGVLQSFAAETPYDLQQTVKAFNQLVNLGLTPSEKALKSYGNTAAAMGKDLSQLVEAVADATTGEFERLKEFGIKSKSEGDQVSFTFRGMTTTVKKSADEIETYLMSLGENEFAGAMEERAKTLDGALSNLGDTWDNLYLTVSQAGVGSAISSSVRTATDAIQGIIDWIKSGAASAMTDAILYPFQGLSKSIGDIFDYIGDLIGYSSEGWSNSIVEFVGNYYKNINLLPAYTANAFDVVIANMGFWVDKAQIYGQLFVDIMQAKLNLYVEKARIAGKSAANYLNPFSDEYDTDGELARADDYSQQIINIMTNQAQTEIEFIDGVRKVKINASDKALKATKLEYETKIGYAKKLLKEFQGRSAPQGDQLAGFKITPTGTGNGDAAEKAKKAAGEYAKWIKQIEKATGVEEQLRAEIEKTKKAMADNHLSSSAGNEYIKQLEDQIKSLNSQKITVFDQITDSTKDALGSIQGLYAQGSKEYQKLGIAIQAVSAAQAVYAVLNQASGDPYTAFGRMAAMAASVASLGYSVGALSGGFADDSAAAQANQGLTVWGDKSESIANAIELTQDATSKLVGINTNMLSALQSMAQNLSKASALIVRDSGGASFSGVNVQENFWDNFGFLNKFAQTWNKTMSFLKFDFLNIGGFIFDTIGKWLGGSSKVTDSGIKIIGGSINDMIDNMTVQAFQDIKYKKWRFGGTKRKTQIQDISDAVGGQFSLVLESMLDSVVYGAQALGISDSTIQSRVNAFEIATQEISLKGLSADEQQAEIEAVFSKIFDDLAIAVVPFAVDFQQVGEGLGETMSRLAIQMQVTQAASDQLGFSFGNASAEMNAFVSNELSAMVGGVSKLASLTSSFVDKFASDEKKLEINTNALNQAMSGVGLGIPATAEGFFNLMGTLDATTEAGRAQIATMLQIQDVAGDYYDLLEDAENDRLAAIQATDSEFNSLTKNLRNMIVSMYDLGDAAETVTLDMALAAAKQGNFELAKQFGGVDIQQADYGSFSEFAFAQAVAANKIDELANLTEDQVSVDERQLNVLEEINKNIISSYNPSALTSGNNTQVNAVAKQQQQDIEQMKYAQQTMAKNAAQTAKILQRIEGGGIDVRVIG